MAHTWLVTGASRGIGLEMARQLHARGDHVIATVRDPSRAGDLSPFADVLPLEVTDQSSIDALAKTLAGRSIDVLVNNAGVSSQSSSIDKTDAAELARCFAINSIAPVMVSKALLPNVRAGRRKTIINISTMLASIANNTGGSSYAYRASKTALNQLSVCMANELRPEGIIVACLHPGWVKTDMGGPKAPLTPPDAVAHILRTIDALTPRDSGRYLNYDGAAMAW